jgi:hypothetical protein
MLDAACFAEGDDTEHDQRHSEIVDEGQADKGSRAQHVQGQQHLARANAIAQPADMHAAQERDHASYRQYQADLWCRQAGLASQKYR